MKRATRKKAPPKRTAQPRVSAPPPPPTDLTLSDVEEDIALIGEKRLTIKELEDDVKVLQERVNVAFEASGQKSAKVLVGGQAWQATFVQGESVVLDEEKLKKRLGTAMWNKVSTRSLDRKKLEAFIKSGEVKATVVAACSDIIPRKPFVKVAKK